LVFRDENNSDKTAGESSFVELLEVLAILDFNVEIKISGNHETACADFSGRAELG